MKNIRIFIRKLSVFGGEIFNMQYLNRRVFVMDYKYSTDGVQEEPQSQSIAYK